MNDPLSELKKECRKRPEPSAPDAIKVGETSWFKGTPVDAPDGTVAIATGGGIKVIVREKDVLKVERRGEHFLVQVSADTTVLVRLDKLTKARPSGGGGGGCGCDKQPDAIARRRPPHGGVGGRGAGLDPKPWPWCVLKCTVVIECDLYLDDPDKSFCIPVPKCDWDCLPPW